MPKFSVTISCTKTFYKTFEIEADDEDAAGEEAEALAMEEDRSAWEEPGYDETGVNSVDRVGSADEAETALA